LRKGKQTETSSWGKEYYQKTPFTMENSSFGKGHQWKIPVRGRVLQLEFFTAVEKLQY
jgi:hypothetical protein